MQGGWRNSGWTGRFRVLISGDAVRRSNEAASRPLVRLAFLVRGAGLWVWWVWVWAGCGREDVGCGRVPWAGLWEWLLVWVGVVARLWM